jgi:hypothetical protein
MSSAQIEHERVSLQRFMLGVYPVGNIAKRSAFDKALEERSRQGDGFEVS